MRNDSVDESVVSGLIHACRPLGLVIVGEPRHRLAKVQPTSADRTPRPDPQRQQRKGVHRQVAETGSRRPSGTEEVVAIADVSSESLCRCSSPSAWPAIFDGAAAEPAGEVGTIPLASVGYCAISYRDLSRCRRATTPPGPSLAWGALPEVEGSDEATRLMASGHILGRLERQVIGVPGREGRSRSCCTGWCYLRHPTPRR
jgi:hypothetical protein